MSKRSAAKREAAKRAKATGRPFDVVLAEVRAERALRDPCPRGETHVWRAFDCGCHMWQSCGRCSSREECGNCGRTR